jgi:rhodanese-related sulfurtransferase
MTQAELAYQHFTHRLAVETDAADVAEALSEGTADFALVDTRSAEAYDGAHLPGAVSLVKVGLDALPPGPLVVYCWGPGCNGATKAGAKISALGREVKEMIGGFEYWVREGHPLEGENIDVWTRPNALYAACATPTAPAI